MKSSLLKLLFAIVLAGVLGTLIARDAGYVMLSYGGHTLQTGLWTFIGLLVVALAASVYAYRLIRFLLSTGGLVRTWRSDRQKARARRLSAQGMAFFNAGEMDRAYRFLFDNAEIIDNSATNYLYAARAANALGNIEQREQCLRLAIEADPGWRQGVLVAAAEMDFESGNHEQALRALDDAGSSETVSRLRSKVLFELRDWDGLNKLLPSLKKLMQEDELLELQTRMTIERLTDARNDDELKAAFSKQPQAVRHNETVITLYCRKLGGEAEAESAIREALGREWLPFLLPLYGELGKETLFRRIKSAEGWLRHHSDDPVLQLCLGQLYEANGDAEKARTAFQKSVDLGGPAEASGHLGRVLAFDGKYKESSEQLTRALTLGSK